MGNLEREFKRVDIYEVLVANILSSGAEKGFPPHKLNLEVSTEKQKKDGTKLVRIEPYLLSPFAFKDIKTKNSTRFLLHNPFDKTEEISYLISLGERDLSDGECVRQIVISKIPSPHKFENKRDWVEQAVNNCTLPHILLSEFPSDNPDFPEILISMHDGSLGIDYQLGLDDFMSKIYSSFPEKSE